MYRDTFFSETEGKFSDSTYAENWQIRGASLSTTFYSARFGNGLYHQIIPEISWEYQSRYGGNNTPEDPDDLFPVLLTGDDIQKTSNVELSLANYIRDSTGSSLADMSLTWIYDYIEDRWRTINAKVNLQPVPWLTASHMNTFDKEPGRPYATQEHSSRISLSDERSDELHLALDFNKLDTELMKLGTKVMLTRGFSVGLEVGYDYRQHEYEHSVESIGYTSQCWVMEIMRKVDPAKEGTPRETTWSLTVRLLGLGDVSTSQSM